MENSQAQPAAAPKRQKHRSPSFPSINLEKALERAQRLWDVAGKHPALLESAVKSWGYSPRSSGGLQSVGALKQYGLLTDSGSGTGRHVALTKEAQELLVYGTDKSSPEWEERACKAALRPKIHRSLWDKYEGSLPADSIMLPFLRLELGFGDEAAAEMLKRFRETLSYAGVSEGGDTVSENGQDSENHEGDEPQGSAEGEDEIVSPTAIQTPKSNPGAAGQGEPKVVQQQRTVQVTYSPTAWALVQAPFPLSEKDWDAMMRVLEGMKPGLVLPDDE
jgi:hypothetical protein